MKQVPGYVDIPISVRVDTDPPHPDASIALHTNGVRISGANPAHPDVFAWMTVAEAEKLITDLKLAIRKARAKST